MVLHGCVKQCGKCVFYLGRGGFHNLSGDRPSKWPSAKKTPSKHAHN